MLSRYCSPLFYPNKLHHKLLDISYQLGKDNLQVAFLLSLLTLGLYSFCFQTKGHWQFPHKEWANLISFRTEVHPNDLLKLWTTFKLRRFHPLDEINLQLTIKTIALMITFVKFNSSLDRSIAIKHTVSSFLFSRYAVHLISISLYIVQWVSYYDRLAYQILLYLEFDLPPRHLLLCRILVITQILLYPSDFLIPKFY